MDDSRYQFVVSVVQKAGMLLLKKTEQHLQVFTKNEDPQNILTNVDVEISSFLIKEIQSHFPGELVYSEESPNVDVSSGTFWSIDPIDGTACFARGIPHYAVVICYIEKGIPIVGAIYNPKTQELFSFQKGTGAFLNTKPVKVSTLSNISEAHIFLTIGRNKDLWSWGEKISKYLLSHANKTRNFGSSALDMCFVGAGRIEACIYGTLTTMDVAAALGFVREAGGKVVGHDGSEITNLSKTNQIVIAANSTKILSELKQGLTTSSTFEG